MSKPKQVDQSAKVALKGLRESLKKGQRAVAADGGVSRSTLARLEAEASAGFSLPLFVGYARGCGRPAWKVLREVEEKIYGDD